MPIETKLVEAAGESYDDYILYEILCDYCDEEYTIKYMLTDDIKPSIEACTFCSNPIEEPEESIIDDDEDSWG